MRKLVKLTLLIPFLWSCEGDFGDDSAGEQGFGQVGVGGSTARFTISGDYLYMVTDSEMKLIDVSEAENPHYVTDIYLGTGIETVFGYKENLFIGGQSGMQIFDISNEENPRFLSEFEHQTACDPVIANDRYAYVTIREGVLCNTAVRVNRLITVDIQDLRNPREVDVYEMVNPRGLAFYKGDLYVGEGNHGLKKFDITDPAHPKLETFYTDIPANDMIGLENTMIITRDDGIFQFGCPQDSLQLLSQLK